MRMETVPLWFTNRGRHYANPLFSLFTWSIVKHCNSFSCFPPTHTYTHRVDVQVSLYLVRWCPNPNPMIPSLGLLSKQLLISAPLLPNAVRERGRGGDVYIVITALHPLPMSLRIESRNLNHWALFNRSDNTPTSPLSNLQHAEPQSADSTSFLTQSGGS